MSDQRYDYCLYCNMEHYPFCGYNCSNKNPKHVSNESEQIINLTIESEECCVPEEEQAAQFAWLETPAGIEWTNSYST